MIEQAFSSSRGYRTWKWKASSCSRSLKSQWTGGWKFGETGTSHTPETILCWWQQAYPINLFGRWTKGGQERNTLFPRSSVPTALVEDGDASPSSLSQLGQVHLSCSKMDGTQETSRHTALLLAYAVLLPSLDPGKCIQMTNSCPHRDPLGEKNLRRFNSKLVYQPRGATRWDHKKQARTAPPQVGQWWDCCGAPMGSMQLRPCPEACGCCQYWGQGKATPNLSWKPDANKINELEATALFLEWIFYFIINKGHFLCKISAKQFITPNIPTLILFSTDTLNLLYSRPRFLDCVALSHSKKWWVTSRTLTFWTSTVVATLLR